MRRCLNHSKLLSVVMLMAFLHASSPASAADTVGRGTPTRSVPTVMPGQEKSSRGSGSAAPLQGVIHLGPGAARGSGSPIVPKVGFGMLNQKFTEFSGSAKAYESGAKMMTDVVIKQCSEKGYTVQDQKAAGCTGNESLNQCMEKLYKHCVMTFSSTPITSPGGGKVPLFSTQLFLITAKTSAAQARAISQLLNQYANEVEQKAKSLVP